jgi:hypothetical protein
MATDSGDKPRAKSASDIIGVIIMPLVVLLVGYFFTTTHDLREEQRQDFEKTTQLMERLTSSNPVERTMTLMVLQHYVPKCELAEVIVPAVIFQLRDPDEQVRKAATEALVRAGEQCPKFKDVLKKEVADNHQTAILLQSASKTAPAFAQSFIQAIVPRVYIHIRDDSQRPSAEKIKSALEGQGFVVPGIQKVSSGPNNTELRFFRSSEAEEAAKAAGALPIFGAKVTLVKGYENSEGIRPRHYEVWLAPGPVSLKSDQEKSDRENDALSPGTTAGTAP